MTLSGLFDTPMGAKGAALLRRLEDAGFAAYFVGGCVRDAMLQRTVKDIDIATSATPDQVMALFPNSIPTGIAHGTVTVRMGEYSFEVTTFRTESSYSDGRRPDSVQFIDDIRSDLMRRDFTINAMAVDVRGRLVDPFGGRKDLSDKLLRAVGNPQERFAEDALRMMRLVRFAAEYGFTPEEATWNEAKLAAPRLSAVAMERIQTELSRMIAGTDPFRAIRLLSESNLLSWTKTRLRLPKRLGLADDPASDPLRRLNGIADELPRWAFWFIRMDLGGEEAERVCEALRTSKAFSGGLRRLLQFHASLSGVPDDPESARRNWVLAAIRFGEETLQSWLQAADAVHKEPEYRWTAIFAQRGAEWLREMPVRSLRDLAAGGDDMLRLAGERRGGPWLADLLQRLLAETALGKLRNEKEALLKRAGELLCSQGIGGKTGDEKK